MQQQLNKDEFKNDVFLILSKLAKIDQSKIKASDRLIEDLNLDSLDRMEALSRIADQYDLDPDLEEMMDVKTVKDVMDKMGIA